MSYPVEWLEYKNEINVSKDVKTSEPLIIADVDVHCCHNFANSVLIPSIISIGPAYDPHTPLQVTPKKNRNICNSKEMINKVKRQLKDRRRYLQSTCYIIGLY